jgi:glucosamine 6-phosphate synthetase-like amidotransferase/phosphosugar isomerase protein
VCGIAGYSLGVESRIDRTLAAQILLAAIAERGSDAAGYAYRHADAPINVHKQRTGASKLLDLVEIPASAGSALFHVRDYTKGHPSLAANNHPIRHGSIVGVHNGIIANDDDLFERHGFERAEAGMTVDSEAIFALVAARGTSGSLLEELIGAMAAAWIDELEPEVLHVARGVGRPLWIARGRHELLFASTRAALEVVERALSTTFRKTQVDEGRLLAVVDGSLAAESRWSPDRSFREEEELPAVRAPNEGRFCLERLAAITGLV